MLRTGPYKRLNQLIADETFEPMISWGMRMAIASIAPILWGIITDRIQDAIWITLTAEAVCWVELKGSFAWRIRTLGGGAVLAAIFALLGSITGSNIWLSTLCMLFVGFLATLLKNMGDRASGLAICVYLLFILANAYPTTTVEANSHTVITVAAMEHRVWLVLAGAAWAMLTGLAVTAVMPAEQPFRRQVALVWRSTSSLIAAVYKGWDGTDVRSNVRDIYQKEKDVRTAIDNSFQFYEKMAYQVKDDKKERQHYRLTLLRKNAAIISVSVVAVSEAVEQRIFNELEPGYRVRLATFFKALEETVGRMAVYMITLKPEELLLITSRMNRLKKLAGLIKQYPPNMAPDRLATLQRITHLTDRIVKLLDSALERINHLNADKPVYRSYSLIKTLFILNPKYLIGNLRSLVNFDTFNTRYALRSAIAASLALFVYKFYNINHGYWLPFSVMIIIQPYFGATFKKAADRVVGTLLGGLTAGLFLNLHSPPAFREIVLFVTFVLMVFYLRRNYAIAAFVITINLVLLFHLEGPVRPQLIITRALCTMGGAVLAVGSGFVLLPTWDRKWLPLHLAGAIDCNYRYFIATFFTEQGATNWTRNKRSAEKNNSNVFDSFNRYMQEPINKDKSAVYYDILIHNVTITRNLNNILSEQENKQGPQEPPTEAQQKQINECLVWFNKVMQTARQMDPHAEGIIQQPDIYYRNAFNLNETQQLYLQKLLIELKSMQQDLEQLTEQTHIE